MEKQTTTPTPTPITILPAAIDFHCLPRILMFIKEKHPNLTLEDIKRAIWVYSSSIRYKFKPDHEDLELTSIWDIIRKDVLSYQKWFITQIESLL